MFLVTSCYRNWDKLPFDDFMLYVMKCVKINKLKSYIFRLVICYLSEEYFSNLNHLCFVLVYCMLFNPSSHYKWPARNSANVPRHFFPNFPGPTYDPSKGSNCTVHKFDMDQVPLSCLTLPSTILILLV